MLPRWSADILSANLRQQIKAFRLLAQTADKMSALRSPFGLYTVIK